ncbi:MAG: hypothetical protein ISS16_08710 [Ignavibacteria bacterium]|nr:hypothetical protein [Ignavibacteria bacterium]
MGKLLNLFLVMLIMTFFIGVIERCSPIHESTQLQDLKAELQLLESQVKTKQEENSKLKKRVAEIDKNITNVLTDFAEVRERCP